MAKNIMYVRLETHSSRLRETLGQIINSTEGFRLRGAEDTGPFDLLILELGQDIEREFQIVQSFTSLGTVREIFLTAQQQDPTILLRALREGIKEFFPQPLNEAEVRQALNNFRQRRDTEKENTRTERIGKIINVAPSKGGVGNTTIAVNLAVELARLNKRRSVALVDMNLLFGEVPLFLDIRPSFHWGEIARNITRLDAMFLMSVLHRHSSGVYVLPAPSELNGAHYLSPDIAENLLLLMKSVFDYTVIDSGLATDEIAVRLIELADNVLVTSILSVPCLTNLNRLSRLLHDLGLTSDDSVRLIVNRDMKDSHISLKDAEESVRMKVSWRVPNDFATTMSAINQGKSLYEVNMNSPVARGIRQIAEDLAGGKTVEEKKGSFLNRIFKRQ
jgi:pilus assembly protein CpaE